MIESPWIGYLLSLAAAGLVSLVLTPLAIRTAIRHDILDRPAGHKSHDTPTPYLGGLAMLFAFMATVVAAAALRPTTGGLTALLTILGLGLLLALVGLADDVRGLGLTVRFGAQILAGVGLWLVDIGVGVTQILWLDLLITVVWVVGITNAMNLLDNMDGLSAGIATIAAMSFGIIGAINGQILVASLAFALAGCAAGFLRHNRPPARIYMGDAGSLFLGVMLASVGIKLEFATHPVIAALVPILVLTVPVMDTSLVVVARLKHGLSPFRGGRDHISHRLVHIGLPVPIAVLLISVAGVAHGWMALVVSRLDLVSALMAAGLTFALDALLFVLLAKVPVYDNSRGPDLVISPRSLAG
ncbi:MAG: undecaprenyl/decaprenyl-phosphate alpha-N-acetylglucosaminyl 1-phosphate transferase [Dehalococcoidia bacterium]